MNKSITILLLFLFIKTYSQETNNNIFDPSISLFFESNGITNYHFTDEKYNHLDVEIPYGMDYKLGFELYQKKSFLSFSLGCGWNNLSYSNSEVRRNNLINCYFANAGYHYSINKKNFLCIKLGFNNSYKVVTKKYKSDLCIEQSDHQQNIYNMDLGIGIEYKLYEKIAIRFEPYLNYTITHVSSLIFNKNLIFSPAVGMKLGLKYTLTTF
ncbi:MAG: hypothetical protein IKU01_01840 [Bacteroidales bacterium]|nr:hypothetical protein [Bacteroidales bacterium]